MDLEGCVSVVGAAYLVINGTMLINYNQRLRQARQEINEYVEREIRAYEGILKVCRTCKWQEEVKKIRNDPKLVSLLGEPGEKKDLGEITSELTDPMYFTKQISELQKERKRDIKPWQVLLFGVYYFVKGDLNTMIPPELFEIKLKKIFLPYRPRPLTAEEMKSYLDSGFVDKTIDGVIKA